MAKKIPTMDSLGSVLEQSLKRLDPGGRLKDYALWPIWNEVVGEIIARNAQPEKIRNGTLFVKVSSPVWMQQLQFMKDIITGKLNQRLRAEVVKNIFFMVGRIDTAEDAPADAKPESAPQEGQTPPDERFLDSIADPEIRRAFGRLIQSYSRRRTKR